jgi:hypothetical protein
LNSEIDIVEIIKHLRISRMMAAVSTDPKQRELVKFFHDYCLSSGDSDPDKRVVRAVDEGEYLLREDRVSRYENDNFIEDAKVGGLKKAVQDFDPKKNKTDKVVYENVVTQGHDAHVRDRMHM